MQVHNSTANDTFCDQTLPPPDALDTVNVWKSFVWRDFVAYLSSPLFATHHRVCNKRREKCPKSYSKWEDPIDHLTSLDNTYTCNVLHRTGPAIDTTLQFVSGIYIFLFSSYL